MALCSAAYHTDYRPFLDSFPEPTHVLVRVSGRLVSHALWITRWLQNGESPLWRSACVEAVATEESYRKRGYASAVMRRLAQEIQDFDIGVLSSADHAKHLYAALGWQLWKGPLFIRIKDGGLLPTPEEKGVMVLLLPNTPPLDLKTPLSAEWREGELW